jgi:transposase
MAVPNLLGPCRWIPDQVGIYPLAPSKPLWHTMGMSTKAPTLHQFQDQFPTEEICLDHLMRTRFGIQHECGSCGRLAKFYRVKARRSYACEWCGYQVFPTSGTPFDRTRTPLCDWFFVMFMFCTTRNGVAAKKVQRDLGVTYKTAWRMCHQIREYMGTLDSDDPLGGPGEMVEIDETIIGGSVSGMGNKTIVVGMLERGGELVSRVITRRTREAMHGLI